MATAAERRAARRKAAQRASVETEMIHTGEKQAAPEPGSSPDAPPPSKTRSRDTVTVACKIPNGLILQNHVLEDAFEPVFGGGSRPIKKSRPVGNPIRLVGPARPFGADPEIKRVIGGFGLTHNVPKDDFEQWMKDNKELDIVKMGLVFAHKDENETAAQARDMKTVQSGLEPLNTESRKADKSYVDPRMPRNIKKYDPKNDESDFVMRA